MYISLDDKLIKEVIKKAFPDYKGRKIQVKYNCIHPMSLKSFWNEGSRNYFVIMELATRKILSVYQNGSIFDKESIDKFIIPDGFIVIEHSIFCGKDGGITIYVKENPLLETGKETPLSKEETIVLYSVRSLKSSYNGDNNIRFHESRYHTGITEKAYTSTKENLITKGYLDRRGAITLKGKNAIENIYNWPI